MSVGGQAPDWGSQPGLGTVARTLVHAHGHTHARDHLVPAQASWAVAPFLTFAFSRYPTPIPTCLPTWMGKCIEYTLPLCLLNCAAMYPLTLLFLRKKGPSSLAQGCHIVCEVLVRALTHRPQHLNPRSPWLLRAWAVPATGRSA